MVEINSIKVTPAFYSQSNGIARIKAKSPYLPINFVLDNGESNNNGVFKRLLAGFYTGSATDSQGNISSVSFEIECVASPLQQEYLDNLALEKTVIGALRLTKAPRKKKIIDIDSVEKEVDVHLTRNTLKEWRKDSAFCEAEDTAKTLGKESIIDECEHIIMKIARGGIALKKAIIIKNGEHVVIKTEESLTLPNLAAAKYISEKYENKGGEQGEAGAITGNFSHMGLPPDLMQEDE